MAVSLLFSTLLILLEHRKIFGFRFNTVVRQTKLLRQCYFIICNSLNGKNWSLSSSSALPWLPFFAFNTIYSYAIATNTIKLRLLLLGGVVVGIYFILWYISDSGIIRQPHTWLHGLTAINKFISLLTAWLAWIVFCFCFWAHTSHSREPHFYNNLSGCGDGDGRGCSFIIFYLPSINFMRFLLQCQSSSLKMVKKRAEEMNYYFYWPQWNENALSQAHKRK